MSGKEQRSTFHLKPLEKWLSGTDPRDLDHQYTSLLIDNKHEIYIVVVIGKEDDQSARYEACTASEFATWLLDRMNTLVERHGPSVNYWPNEEVSTITTRVDEELINRQITQRDRQLLFGRYFDSTIGWQPAEWDGIVDKFVRPSQKPSEAAAEAAMMLWCMVQPLILDGMSPLPEYDELPLMKLRGFIGLIEEWS